MARRTLLGLAILVGLCPAAEGRAGEAAEPAHFFSGRVLEADGSPVPGAMVTVRNFDPFHELTVFSDAQGRYRTPPLHVGPSSVVRARRIGWRDLRLEGQRPGDGASSLDLVMERESDPAAVAEQLPANRWYGLVLAAIDDPAQREELTRQCTFCHQQGNAATRRRRDEEEWRKVLALMGRMGGMISRELREQLPAILNAAYDPAHAVPALTAGLGGPDFAPPPPPEVRRALIEEWELGGRASTQHDLVFHPDGTIYSVDMSQDTLYRLDPRLPAGERRSWPLPRGDLPVGGVFADLATPALPNANAHVGPHSLQVAPDGSLWITLALGNQLARFDPSRETFEIHELQHGYYPHTLRFDPRGRIWYTIAASNHVGMFDPATGEHREIRLPAGSLGQAVVLRMLPVFLWLGRHVDLRGRAAEGNGMDMPVPYGIDVAPDGAVWLSQLNQHRIGRVDPESFAIEMLDTPFTGPRRLRFDARGQLWIPGFSANVLARFDPVTREFREWQLPIEPLGSETPYALHVERRSGQVWICGTNSDTLIRFEPERERFTVYPLPTRVTYTREIDFDREGRVWTSNSNAPTWQVEGGTGRVLRLDPDGAPDPAVRVARGADPR